MIDERTLRDVLEEMAADIAVPETGPREILEAVEAIGPRGQRRWASGRSFLAAAAAVVVIAGSVGFIAMRRGGHTQTLARDSSKAASNPLAGANSAAGEAGSGSFATSSNGAGTTAAGS